MIHLCIHRKCYVVLWNETELNVLTDRHTTFSSKNKSQDNKYIMLFAHQGSVHVQVCNNLSNS